MSLKSHNVLFIDLQTTGTKPDNAHILEIAWSSLQSEKIESYLVQQPEQQSIPRRIQAITGIFEEDMEHAIPLAEVIELLNNFIVASKQSENEHTIAVIHFAQFERPFLLDAYKKINQELPFTILCTHEIAKRLLPNLPTRGIKGLAGYFGCPSGELKRATNHVQATQIIWQGLIQALAEKDINTFPELQLWQQDTPKVARSKYEYPLAKEKRLNLPKHPGVYRMMSRWGEVLYVGKATSLHSRVNSYFRGQKNRDTRKLEMLTQVWDLQVTPVESPLEAALLETDEIKRLDPPYNISLKTGTRSMAFFNKDFTSVSLQYDQEHVIGPFSNIMVLDSMIRLSHSLMSPQFDENIFFEPLDHHLLQEGFDLFCQRHGFDKLVFASVRSILAAGLNWVRKLKEEEPENTPQEDDVDDTFLENDEAITEEPLATELTSEDIADKFERHFIRSAKAYLRTKKLTRLLNADIYFSTKKSSVCKKQFTTRQGEIVRDTESPKQTGSWENLSIDTYDRMTVLYTELEKLRSKKHAVQVMRPEPAT